MIRISRMADYALLVVFKMRSCEQLITQERLCELTSLSLPTMRKLMRALTLSDLVTSVRGPRGGYKLSSKPDQISIAQIIEAIDGPIALTECAKSDGGDCQIASSCELKENWNIVNRVISNALHNVTLDAMGTMPMDINRLKSALTKLPN
ncbi:SUF system Fe-S cluster assembly regulator [Brumicola pallidula]|jgi:FeS assembly SUF system regulator|uniref:HTH-type transcriptional regulator iscR n=1 Tax=Brumicola pallidula DSM 14239 = ACAM 615 TaxID=1121922 RepID=K6Z9E6_9ALTE|nr:SUF system Fe-S cluster assembly regulator [Glaciecola pallidula]GAC26992.1 HTH-type transcriptional regulator iscR [Glaciecola pallidula DSM 14239 = ACAM 615]